jgi:NADH dehydrogenase
VSPEDYFLYTPLLPDVAGGLLDPRHLAVPLAQALPGVEVVRGLATSVDLNAKGVTVEMADRPSEQRTVRWDRLVLTAGSVTKLFDVPGLREHARGLKTLAEALYLRDHVLGHLELSMSERDERLCRACRTVVVVGASYSGTELVSQLRGLADTAALHYGFDPAEARFLLLDLAKRVMPEVGPHLGDRVLEVLRRRGIDVRLGTTLTRVDDDEVTLSDNSVVPARTVAWVTGVTASPLIGELGLRLEKGRLVVSECLDVPGHSDVFAGGDAAAVPDLTNEGAITPPTAQHAVRQGRALARNVLASFGFGVRTPYRHRNLGMVVDLGPGFAVANPLGLRLAGLPAKAVTRAYHLRALPRLANRALVGAEYLLGAGLSRPVVALGLVDPRRSSVTERELLGVGG